MINNQQNMEYNLKCIPRYNDIVNRKVARYVKRQRKIWKYYFDRINIPVQEGGIYTSHATIERTWYSYCVWEIKNVPRIKTIVEKHTMVIKNKINAYMSILSKAPVCDVIDYNIMLRIIEYILRN